jgi:hypothetical protein
MTSARRPKARRKATGAGAVGCADVVTGRNLPPKLREVKGRVKSELRRTRPQSATNSAFATAVLSTTLVLMVTLDAKSPHHGFSLPSAQWSL